MSSLDRFRIAYRAMIPKSPLGACCLATRIMGQDSDLNFGSFAEAPLTGLTGAIGEKLHAR
jgi:hypothetical protein